MKTHFLTIITLCTILLVSLHTTAQEDSVSVAITNHSLDLAIETDQADHVSYPRVFGGLTFTRIEWGFSRLIDNGSFQLSESNKFLSYSRASNFGFDVLQAGLRFCDNFKTFLSAGVEWNYIRLEENILFDRNTSPLSYQDIDPADIAYEKNILTSTYLRVPLTFEWRSRKYANGKRSKIAFGLTTGVLLKGTQRLKSGENGKQKFKNDYNLATFQYGPFVKVGYDRFGIFAKYYMNDMFDDSPAIKGVQNLAFGASLGF